MSPVLELRPELMVNIVINSLMSKTGGDHSGRYLYHVTPVLKLLLSYLKLSFYSTMWYYKVFRKRDYTFIQFQTCII